LDAYAAFRFRDYRLLLTGGFLATFGLQMMFVAASWDLYLNTHSALVLGNVGFVQVAPYLLFALHAGQIADRYDRRRILAFTQFLLAAASLLLVFNSRSVALIYLCLFLTATARAFQGPARQAVLPHVVPPETLSNAITWNSSAFEVASVTGPALAGILVASAGSRTVYIVQLACAVLTFACFVLLRVPVAPDHEMEPFENQSILDGLRFVWTNKLILSAVSLDLFAVLFGGATALLPIFAVDVLRAGARGLGWLRAAPSIGAVAMAVYQAHSKPVQRAGRALLFAVAAFGIATIVFAVSRSLPLSFCMLVLTGAFDNVSVVLRQSLVQTMTPERVRGRVLAVNSIFISCSNQLGAVESGWTAAWLGATTSVIAGGAATVVIVALFLAGSKPLRRWRQAGRFAEFPVS
jgi:MFS family permease